MKNMSIILIVTAITVLVTTLVVVIQKENNLEKEIDLYYKRNNKLSTDILNKSVKIGELQNRITDIKENSQYLKNIITDKLDENSKLKVTISKLRLEKKYLIEKQQMLQSKIEDITITK